MNVRAKFCCNSETRTQATRQNPETHAWELLTVSTWKFSPVTSGSQENKEFFASTPGGSLEIYCVNPDVKFELGKEYYLDFTLASGGQ